MLSEVSLQDRDLLARLTQYFASFESRLREGQGWLIFNSPRPRTTRVAQFITDRLNELRPLFSFYVVPWRDFALNAYMMKVELVSLTPPSADHLSLEYRIAGRVTQDMVYHMRYTDLLVLPGVNPEHPHEVEHLSTVIEARREQRRPSVLITPLTPQQMGERIDRLLHQPGYWDQLFTYFYQTSLIAL
ncbi:MAG: hypothetical protein HYY04_01955 [Chloroflexi bacterium]|nr:hypothetical protein [Chloroflexota bacterium]